MRHGRTAKLSVLLKINLQRRPCVRAWILTGVKSFDSAVGLFIANQNLSKVVIEILNLGSD